MAYRMEQRKRQKNKEYLGPLKKLNAESSKDEVAEGVLESIDTHIKKLRMKREQMLEMKFLQDKGYVKRRRYEELDKYSPN